MLSRVAFGTDAEHPYRRAEAQEDASTVHLLQSSRPIPPADRNEQKQPALLSMPEEDATVAASISLKERGELIKQLIDGLRNREIYTRVYRFGRFDLTGADTESEQRKIIELYKQPRNRATYLKTLKLFADSRLDQWQCTAQVIRG